MALKSVSWSNTLPRLVEDKNITCKITIIQLVCDVVDERALSGCREVGNGLELAVGEAVELGKQVSRHHNGIVIIPMKEEHPRESQYPWWRLRDAEVGECVGKYENDIAGLIGA